MAGGGRRRALRGRGALPEPPVRDPAPGRAPGGRPALGRHGRRDRDRDRGRPGGGADLPAARREARRPLRFHLENVEGQDVGDVLEAFCLEYYGSAPSIPPQLVVPPRRRRHGRARGSSSPTGAARASRCARPARGEKRRLAGARRPERAARARVRPDPVRAAAPPPRRGARGAPRGAEPREPADPDRVLRHLEHPGRVAGRLDGRLPGRGRRRRRTTGSSASGGSTGRTTSPRSPRWCRGGSRGSAT